MLASTQFLQRSTDKSMSTPPLVTGPLTTPSRDTPFVRSVRKEEEADFWIGAKEDDVGRAIRQYKHEHGNARMLGGGLQGWREMVEARRWLALVCSRKLASRSGTSERSTSGSESQ